MLFKSPKILRWLYPRRIWGISVSSPTVFLTFDDGPDPEITPWLLDFLNQEAIVATFFCVGSNVKAKPSLYQQIIADGHAVGNHLMDHENGYKTNNQVYLNSVAEASKYIDSNLFRPAYGRLTRKAERELRKNYKIIMWSWLSYDYDVDVPIIKIIGEAKKIKAGDILVFHDNKKTKERLKEVLPEVIGELKRKGFEFGVI